MTLVQPTPEQGSLATQWRHLCQSETSAGLFDTLDIPARTWPGLDGILALHWHPESVPLPIAERRFRALYPDAREWLLIPTQHNRLTGIDGFHGVEVDCKHRGRKLQLLLHFHGSRVLGDSRFHADLGHTCRYRARQLEELLLALTHPDRATWRMDLAQQLDCPHTLGTWIKTECRILAGLITGTDSTIDVNLLKNKLVRDWLLIRLGGTGHPLAAPLLMFLKAVKEAVKSGFALDWFLSADDWIRRTHELGGTVTLPHPELFWDSLEAGLALDGVEVWNPQSSQRTEELLAALVAGRIRGHAGLPVLPTFGDDCHLGEKVKPPGLQDPEKAAREIGHQPAWDWPGIQTLLKSAGWDRTGLVRSWKQRLKA